MKLAFLHRLVISYQMEISPERRNSQETHEAMHYAYAYLNNVESADICNELPSATLEILHNVCTCIFND